MSAARKFWVVAASLGLLMLAPAVMAGPARFTTIDYPGAVATYTLGINPAGDIVGGYVDAETEHGFVLRSGTFTPFDYPGSVWTEAEAITPEGEVLGQYGLSDNTTHGFLLRKGAFHPVDVPEQPSDEGLPNTMPVKISPEGTIVGCYHESTPDGSTILSTMYGFVMTGDRVISFPLAGSMNNGVNPAGDVTGILFVGTAVPSSYVMNKKGKKDVTTWFQFPGSKATQAWDINSKGVIVGFHRDATGVHGFVREREQMTSFDVPGSIATRAYGINAPGDIIGYYSDSTGDHGFLLSGRGPAK